MRFRDERGESAYRGGDRRGGIVVTDAPFGPAFVGMALLIVFLAGLFIVGPQLLGDPDGVDPAPLRSQLDAASFAIALMLGALCLLRWRLIGDAPAFWLGWAGLVYGVMTLGAGHLVPLVASDVMDVAVLAWMHPATRIVVIVLVMRGLRSADVDARLKAPAVMVFAAAAIAVLTVLFQLFPDAAVWLSSAADTTILEVDAYAGSLVLAAAWATLAGLSFWRAGRHGHRLVGFFGLLFTSLAIMELLRFAEPSELGVWSAGAPLLRMMGLLAALAGALLELHRAYLLQGGRLFESMTSEMTAEARIEAERTAQAERAHEARNALTAIEGATKTLEHYRDRLDPETRESLAEAVSAEIHRLQQLITMDGRRTGHGRFWLGEAISAVVTVARSQGVRITVDVPEDLVAIGQPTDTAQVIQNLIENARRYAGGEIDIIGEREGDTVILRVEDRGPGIAERERPSIFERGVRGTSAAGQPGSGLGLYVSARLMRDQGGELSVEDRPGGGSSFVLRLPGFSGVEGDGIDDGSGIVRADHTPEEPDEVGQIAHDPRLLAGGPDEPSASGIAGVGDDHDGVGHDVGRQGP